MAYPFAFGTEADEPYQLTRIRRLSSSTQTQLPVIAQLCSAVSEELLIRLSEYPLDRFKLNSRLFEETVAELLFRMGYEVKLTPKSGDKGRDIIANIATPTAPLLMLVECKRYASHRLVGPEPITRLWFQMFNENANLAMLVTTSSFQPVAKKTAALSTAE
jgi:restriction system protein